MYVVSAAIGTGAGNWTSCQPLTLASAGTKTAVARAVPALFHKVTALGPSSDGPL
jgi:hypothetical protein